MAARLLASLALGALLQHADAWQGAAGPNYYTGDVTLDLHSLTAPTAVCNDGSPAGYYYSAGTNSQLWVVYLEGGASPVLRAWRRGGSFLVGVL